MKAGRDHDLRAAALAEIETAFTRFIDTTGMTPDRWPLRLRVFAETLEREGRRLTKSAERHKAGEAKYQRLLAAKAKKHRRRAPTQRQHTGEARP